jgi:hypothetical protein
MRIDKNVGAMLACPGGIHWENHWQSRVSRAAAT